MMVRLEYFNGNEWVKVGVFFNEKFAWVSLGGDDKNYRTVDMLTGNVLTENYKELITEHKKEL